MKVKKKSWKIKIGHWLCPPRVFQARQALVDQLVLNTKPWLLGSIAGGLVSLPVPRFDVTGGVDGWDSVGKWATKKRAKPGWLDYFGDYMTELYRDYFINQHKDPYYPTRISCKERSFFFFSLVAQMTRHFFGQICPREGLEERELTDFLPPPPIATTEAGWPFNGGR